MPEHHGVDWERAFDSAYRAAHGVLRDSALAEDVAQEACIKALVRVDTFEGTGSFAGWVRKIAHNLALDVLRSRKPAGPDPDELASNDDPEASAFTRQASEALHRCLGELTEHQRQIFLGKHLDGMKGAEVAAEVNVREGTVWATLSQAAANLRECLGRLGFERGALH